MFTLNVIPLLLHKLNYGSVRLQIFAIISNVTLSVQNEHSFLQVCIHFQGQCKNDNVIHIRILDIYH